MAVDWRPPTYVELALADAEQLAAAHLEMEIIDHNHQDQIDDDDGDDHADDNDNGDDDNVGNDHVAGDDDDDQADDNDNGDDDHVAMIMLLAMMVMIMWMTNRH